jgi:trypsin-like peptidase
MATHFTERHVPAVILGLGKFGGSRLSLAGSGGCAMRRMKRLAAVLCACASFVSARVLPASSQTVQSVAAAATRSVCIVLAERGNGTTSGTGFMVADGFVLTARHVVQGADRLRVLCPEHPAIDISVVNTDADNDTALLRGTLLSVRPLPIGESANVQVGQEIVVIGFPRTDLVSAETATVTRGIVSSVRAGALQIQAPVGPGNSGSPVLTLQGQVIGVVRAVLGSQVGSNVATSFATAIDAIKPLLTFGVNVGNALPARQAPEPGFIITPGRGIGDLKLGMSRNEIEHLLGPAKHISRTADGGFRIDWFVQAEPPRGFFAVVSRAGDVIMIGVDNDPRYILQGLHAGSTEIEVRAALGEPSRVELANDSIRHSIGAAKLIYYDSLGLRLYIVNNPEFATNGLVIVISITRPGCIFKGTPPVLQGSTCH